MSAQPAMTYAREAALLKGCTPVLRRIYTVLQSVAAAGAEAPSNAAMGERVGCSTAVAGVAYAQLAAMGLIAIERYGAGRLVTLAASGRATARPLGKHIPTRRKPNRAGLPSAVRAQLAPIDPAPMPPRIDREPCFYCGVRADIGCAHQPRAEGGAG